MHINLSVYLRATRSSCGGHATAKWNYPVGHGVPPLLLCSTNVWLPAVWKEFEMYIGGGLIGTILIVLLVLFVLGRI